MDGGHTQYSAGGWPGRSRKASGACWVPWWGQLQAGLTSTSSPWAHRAFPVCSPPGQPSSLHGLLGHQETKADAASPCGAWALTSLAPCSIGQSRYMPQQIQGGEVDSTSQGHLSSTQSCTSHALLQFTEISAFPKDFPGAALG